MLVTIQTHISIVNLVDLWLGTNRHCILRTQWLSTVRREPSAAAVKKTMSTGKPGRNASRSLAVRCGIDCHSPLQTPARHPQGR